MFYTASIPDNKRSNFSVSLTQQFGKTNCKKSTYQECLYKTNLFKDTITYQVYVYPPTHITKNKIQALSYTSASLNQFDSRNNISEKPSSSLIVTNRQGQCMPPSIILRDFASNCCFNSLFPCHESSLSSLGPTKPLKSSQ